MQYEKQESTLNCHVKYQLLFANGVYLTKMCFRIKPEKKKLSSMFYRPTNEISCEYVIKQIPDLKKINKTFLHVLLYIHLKEKQNAYEISHLISIIFPIIKQK